MSKENVLILILHYCEEFLKTIVTVLLVLDVYIKIMKFILSFLPVMLCKSM